VPAVGAENVAVDVHVVPVQLGVENVAVSPVGATVPNARVTGPVNPLEQVNVTVAVADPEAPVTVLGLTDIAVQPAGGGPVLPYGTVVAAANVSV
jgi:hypothetical protein